jgi:uncharacterized protein YjbI with pentapeptide repeats
MSPLPKKVIAWVAAGIATVTVVVVVLLWWAGTRGLEGEKLVTARFDALRVGLSIGLGGGGLFALYLAWRRQHSTEIGLAQKQQDQVDVARAYELQRETFATTRQHQERVASATKRDADARRVTDLYTKAVEQLGSEKAPVRLGGFYALERLAQDHVEQRQTIVNVLCAYLRMPYSLPGDPPDDDADDKLTAHRERVQEREVRLAAQRILAHHLRPGKAVNEPVKTFWADIELDLTGATLINFDLTRCVTLNARFNQTIFTGHSHFSDTTFMGSATFSNATFTDHVWFSNATFTSDARFGEVTFMGSAWFGDVIFEESATFSNTTFAGNATKDTPTFSDAFEGSATFSNTTFTGNASFRGANFAGNAWFRRTNFASNADFERATFTGFVEFRQAALPGILYTDNDFITREPWIDLRGTLFKLGVPSEFAPFVSLIQEKDNDDKDPE